MNRYTQLAVIVAAMAAAAAQAQQLGPSPARTAPAASPASSPTAPQAQQPEAKVPPLPKEIAAADGATPKPGAGLTPEAFAAMLNTYLPLNPSQVKEVNRRTDAVKRATNARVGPAPIPVSVPLRVTLAAGAPPAIVRLDIDTVTTLVFNDVTGAPWRVLEVRAGGSDLLDIPDRGKLAATPTNMFTVSPKDDHISTNLAVFLEGAPAPVTILVVTNQKEVDYRVDVSVQARGPAAVMPMISHGLAESVSPELTSMVSGVAPAAAKPLKIVASDFPDVQAWVMGDRMYVRSRANVLAPPVPKDGKVATGADGTKVYELPHASEVLLMEGGSVGHLRLAGFPPPGIGQLAGR